MQWVWLEVGHEDKYSFVLEGVPLNTPQVNYIEKYYFFILHMLNYFVGVVVGGASKVYGREERKGE